MPARPFHYHMYDDPAFSGKGDFAEITRSVPKNANTGGTESKKFYSLKRDMEKLRQIGAAKGIVDGGFKKIGTSTLGKDILALKVGKGSHKVLFTGCHHAREWISVEIPYLVAEYLIENYTDAPANNKQRRIKHLLDNRKIWFVPMVNPDGHTYTVTTNRWWRGNRKAYTLPAGVINSQSHPPGKGRPISYPADTYTGPDLNRNYNTANWGKETFAGASVTTSRDPRDANSHTPYPRAALWCGPGGSSEKESKAVDNLIVAEKFKSSLTYHNFSQLLLYPDAAAADTFVQNVGKGMRDLINQYGNPYTYQSGSSLYYTTGDLMDFTYEKVPGRPTYTPELRPKDSAPRIQMFSGLPESEIEPCFKENLAAALALINCAGFNAVAGSNTCKVYAPAPPHTCTVVKNCWRAFKGWSP